jgi:hypothetical protein
VDTPYRWKDEESDPTDAGNLGRPKVLSEGALMRLAEVSKKVMSQISVSTFVMSMMFREELVKLACPRPNLSISWTRDFLINMACTNKGNNKSVVRKTQEEVDWAIKILKLKIAFMRKLHNIPWERVWGMDETSLQLLPTYKRGWSEKNTTAKVIGDDHTNVTGVVMHGTTTGDWQGQIIFQGKTERVLPTQNVSPRLEYTQTENHWVNDDTIMKSLAMMDKALNPHGEGVKWLLVWDVCPNHISKAIRAASLEKIPHLIKVYVKPRFTGESQPADVALMAPVKAVIRRVASEDLCKIVVANIDEDNPLADVVKRNVLKNKVAVWFETAMTEVMNNPKLFDKAWRHLRVSDDERLQIEAEAEALHNEKKLFETAGRNKIVPEEDPTPDEEELPADVLGQPEEAWNAFGIEGEVEDEDVAEKDEGECDFSPTLPQDDEILPPPTPPVAQQEIGPPPEEREEEQLTTRNVMSRFAALRICYGSRDPLK